jgi:hypothetical protein
MLLQVLRALENDHLLPADTTGAEDSMNFLLGEGWHEEDFVCELSTLPSGASIQSSCKSAQSISMHATYTALGFS